MGSAGEGVRKGCCRKREKQGSGVPQKRKKNSWQHQTGVEGSSLGRCQGSRRGGIEGLQPGKADGRFLRWQQGDVLEDASFFLGSPGGTWAGGEQPITSLRGRHTSTTARAVQQHRPCRPLPLGEAHHPQNLTQKTPASARVCAEPETTAWQVRTPKPPLQNPLL